MVVFALMNSNILTDNNWCCWIILRYSCSSSCSWSKGMCCVLGMCHHLYLLKAATSSLSLLPSWILLGQHPSSGICSTLGGEAKTLSCHSQLGRNEDMAASMWPGKIFTDTSGSWQMQRTSCAKGKEHRHRLLPGPRWHAVTCYAVIIQLLIQQRCICYHSWFCSCDQQNDMSLSGRYFHVTSCLGPSFVCS